MLQLALLDPVLAGHAVEDLERGGVAIGGVHHPVEEDFSLVPIAEAEERVKGERGVAQPAIAIIPVAGAPEALRQRGRRRGDDRAGRGVVEELQRQRRATHHRPVRAVVGAPADPAAPVLGRLLEESPGHCRDVAVPEERRPAPVGQHEDGLVALTKPAAAGRRVRRVVDRQRHGGVQRQRFAPAVRHPCSHARLRAPGGARPGGRARVVEARREVAAEFDGPGQAAGDAHDRALAEDGRVATVVLRRHEVEQLDHAGGGGEGRGEDVGVVEVVAFDCVVADGRYLPVAAVRGVKDAREGGGRIEAREAGPIDRAVAPDQRGADAVADEGIVFDRQVPPLRGPVRTLRAGLSRRCAHHRHSPPSHRTVPLGAPRVQPPCHRHGRGIDKLARWWYCTYIRDAAPGGGAGHSQGGSGPRSAGRSAGRGFLGLAVVHSRGRTLSGATP
ncbi:MAG: hypothetical protein AVDCRST_MAG88-644 [uncultured Thermomicrobiales bacterium]|uniref:Uncharacterized protein n=1 Tax=uncultured Thermomicrobiales bacterium TaxID=1645740 RepID=A0A6J4UFA9_9BACT|nr:MAG: hypothetical protein AVDCRST_MAG88-644 [uncultured Thermomicrobiales bacterium]